MAVNQLLPLAVPLLLLASLLVHPSFAEDPLQPDLLKDAIGDDHFNISFVPGKFDPTKQLPVGNAFYVRYREPGEEEWKVVYYPNNPIVIIPINPRGS